MPIATPARLAIDIGGTFTDVVVQSGDNNKSTKVLTTHGAPEAGVIEGLKLALAAAELRPADIGLIIHGTTLATNALIERKGARTALLTTAGFRDTIELGTESRFDQYDLNLVKRAPLVPRNWRIPIIERVAADGQILLPLDERSVLYAIERLREDAIESVAVAFLHSYVEPAHERRVRALLNERLPQIVVSLSSEVSPEMREYERFTTTCANAYVQPLIAGYLGRLERDLACNGFRCPLFLMLSGGGLTTVETARAFPIRLVESGPAGGAIFARNVAIRHGASGVVSFDMGGTTAKLCLIDDFKPQTARVFEVDRSSRFIKGSGMPVRIPVLELVEIGAGGGSIARIDKLGRITIGPDSAGSMPGPACYGRGGAEPTVTDADVLLGRIDVRQFAGGRLALDQDLAEAAIARTASAARLALNVDEFSYAIMELVDEAMANAARVHAVESGKNLSDRTLIAFGGAAPLHACRVADKLGIARIVVPLAAGVGSAIGFLEAPVSYEVTRSLYMRLDAFDADAINAMFEKMAREARAIVGPGTREPLLEQRSGFARYVGQGHEIPISLPVTALAVDDAQALRRSFEASYGQQYGRLIDAVDIEMLAWTLTIGSTPPRPLPSAPPERRAAISRASTRSVYDAATGRHPVAVVRRAELAPGEVLRGPAIVVEESTSTVVSADYDAEIAADHSIVMTRRAAR